VTQPEIRNLTRDFGQGDALVREVARKVTPVFTDDLSAFLKVFIFGIKVIDNVDSISRTVLPKPYYSMELCGRLSSIGSIVEAESVPARVSLV
jgi:hypothetical protein